MNREAHVRICEGVGVKFPRATRLRNIGFHKDILIIISYMLFKQIQSLAASKSSSQGHRAGK
jgi:hypothetical protein